MTDKRRYVFFQASSTSSPPGMRRRICRMAFDQDRLGGADQRRDLDDMPDLLDRLDRSLDWIAAIRLSRRSCGVERGRTSIASAGTARLALLPTPGRSPSAAPTSCPKAVSSTKPRHRCRDAAGDQRVAADEFRDEQRLWPGVEFIGRADLLDPPGVHHDDPIRERQRLRLRVGDEDEGDAEAALQQLQLVLNALAQIGVERAERLVEQQDVGLDHKRASERDALLLPAGQSVGA